MVFVKCLSYGWQIMIKVLIVDDEYIMRRGLKYMIDWEQEGFEIVGEATNGAEALQCIENRKKIRRLKNLIFLNTIIC